MERYSFDQSLAKTVYITSSTVVRISEALTEEFSVMAVTGDVVILPEAAGVLRWIKINIIIHPASCGVAAHTAGLFWIVTHIYTYIYMWFCEPEFRRGICACKD